MNQYITSAWLIESINRLARAGVGPRLVSNSCCYDKNARERRFEYNIELLFGSNERTVLHGVRAQIRRMPLALNPEFVPDEDAHLIQFVPSRIERVARRYPGIAEHISDKFIEIAKSVIRNRPSKPSMFGHLGGWAGRLRRFISSSVNNVIAPA
jgi:hypothetical protein